MLHEYAMQSGSRRPYTTGGVAYNRNKLGYHDLFFTHERDRPHTSGFNDEIFTVRNFEPGYGALY